MGPVIRVIRAPRLAAVCLALIASLSAALGAQSPQELFQRALTLERSQGKLDSAGVLYRRVAAAAGANRALAARALLRLGNIYEVLGRAEARASYERVMREYGDQRDLADQARARVAALDRSVEQSGTGRTLIAPMARQVASTDSMYVFGSPSPDGRYLSYSDRATRDLVLYDLKSDSSRHIVAANWQASGVIVDNSKISPDGRSIAFAWSPTRRGTGELRVIPVRGGESLTVPLGHSRLTGLYGWTPDGASLLARVDSDALDLIDVASGQIHRLGNPGSGPSVAADASPDGRWIAFDLPASNVATANRGIYGIRNDGSHLHLMVEPQSSDWSPHWTPDGRGIVFLSDRTGAWGLWYLEVIDGMARGQPVLLKADVGRIQPLGFSRDGRLFYTPIAATYLAVDRLDSLTGAPLGQSRLVAPMYAGSASSGNLSAGPDWSPDSRSLVFMAVRGFDVRLSVRALSVVDLGTGQQREFSVPLTQFQNPRWSRDGRSILVGGSGPGYGPGYHRVDVKTGALETLAPMPGGAARGADWSADGRSIFYQRPDSVGGTSLWRYDIDDATRHAVYAPDSLFSVESVSPSPDGAWIALTAAYQRDKSNGRSLILSLASGEARDLPQPGLAHDNMSKRYDSFAWLASGNLIGTRRQAASTVELWRVPLDGSPAVKLTSIAQATGLPRISPDGRLIATPLRLANEAGVWTIENLLPMRPKGR